MRLTMLSDYALRVLMFAAAHPGRLVTIDETLRAYEISRGHLMKVVTVLGQAGFLRSQRGRAGGFTLARAPDQIALGAVLRATEPDFRLVECLGEGNACAITGPCRLPGIVSEALAAFLAVMDRHSLADLALQPEAFAPEVALAPPHAKAPPR
jgi:Rrf2 family nitric oxide-sensitive transcriptional repressor